MHVYSVTNDYEVYIPLVFEILTTLSNNSNHQITVFFGNNQSMCKILSTCSLQLEYSSAISAHPPCFLCRYPIHVGCLLRWPYSPCTSDYCPLIYTSSSTQIAEIIQNTKSQRLSLFMWEGAWVIFSLLQPTFEIIYRNQMSLRTSLFSRYTYNDVHVE